MSHEEAMKLKKFHERTTSNSLSEYARDVLLQEPVTVLFRNQSADDFLREMVHLKEELRAIGNNFNLVISRLHTLNQIPDVKAWAILNENSKRIFLRKMEEIAEKMNEIYLQWLQK